MRQYTFIVKFKNGDKQEVVAFTVAEAEILASAKQIMNARSRNIKVINFYDYHNNDKLKIAKIYE